MISDKIADAGLTALQKAGQALAGVREGSDSLVGYTSAARVEPLCLIDSSLVFSDSLPEVMQSLQSIFTGYYLQAWALSANVGDIQVIKQLEKLNPNRNGQADLVGLVAGDSLGLESIADLTHRLPSPGDPRNYEDRLALEAESGGSAGKDPGAELRQLTNLSVGKLVNVTIQGESGKTVTIPVSIRLLANSISPQALTHILSAGSKDTSFKERVYQWKSGEIQFFKDLVLCQDLIDEHKKHLSNDQTGFYSAILNRRTNNALSSAVTGNYSVATASNLVVMSNETQVHVELETGGRLKDFKTRQKIFEKTYLMIMAVIDTSRDRVTFYHRGIPEATNLSMRDLKAANKNGVDVSDVLAAYRMASAPSL